ncbi:MAG TPA: hypothetical protein VL625_10955 [Patescibacteria group bacterium]|nr:hypothetical protein [Patescibacteria group bacterium]
MFWAAIGLISVFLALSLYIMPAHYELLFAALCAALFIGICACRKKNSGPRPGTDAKTILQTGTLAQKLGVFMFSVIFGGPLGWGMGSLILMRIYTLMSGDGPPLGYDALLLGISLVFSILLASFQWIGALADRGHGKFSRLWRYLKYLILLLCLASVGFDFGAYDTSQRYRLTVAIDTPEGVVTGSGVREITIHRRFSLWDGYWRYEDFSGEAVAIDLGKRGVLFALLTGAKGSYGDQAFARKMRDAGKTVLPPAYYPRLVRFKEPDYPQTIEDLIEVSGAKPGAATGTLSSNRLGQAFGQGAKLKEIALNRTSDAITAGLETHLPWLPCIEPLRFISAPFVISLVDPSGTDLTVEDFQRPPPPDGRGDAVCKEYIEKWKAFEEKRNDRGTRN